MIWHHLLVFWKNTHISSEAGPHGGSQDGEVNGSESEESDSESDITESDEDEE